MANEVQVAFSDRLKDSLVAAETALPKDFNSDRFVMEAVAVLNDCTNLSRIPPAQLILGLKKGAYLGLSFLAKECYLIPYGNTVQFQTDYKGEIKFAKRYSTRKIKDIYAKLVRKGDEFVEEVKDGQPVINFKPIPFSNEEIVGVFAVCLFEDGGMIYEAMSTAEVNEVRNNYSKQANGNAWKKSWGEQAKKTVLRRLLKHIPTDFYSIEAHKAWEEGSDLDTKKTAFGEVRNQEEVVNAFTDEDVIDVEGVVVDGTDE